MRPNIFPQALDTAAIFASTGRLWMTNETSLRCCFANVCAWPRMPKPVMSVAACALNVCMRLAAVTKKTERTDSESLLKHYPVENKSLDASYMSFQHYKRIFINVFFFQ